MFHNVKLGCCLAWMVLAPWTIGLGQQEGESWNQWRGPTRDGQTTGPAWPTTLSKETLQESWKVELPPSYSGPIVSETAVFVTGTENGKNEVVYALNRENGERIWRAEWAGAMTVPFFALANGSWIRATPALDGDTLYVAGMRDVLVALNAKTGEQQWRVDFVEKFGTDLPAFGFVSSPLIDGDALYVQAGASLCKLNKATGEVLWRVLKDDGGMMGSAFSSPVIATIAGQRQLVVQTRQKLAGVNLDSGDVFWEQPVPNFRGMNILTPLVHGDSIFTSGYQKNSWLYTIAKTDDGYAAEETWTNNAQGYMSSPVLIDGHAYLHLQNERFTCIDLATGKRKWTSKPMGKYCSLIVRDKLILALASDGRLLLIQADPEKFELLAEQQVSDQETWAHLAKSGSQLFVRELNGLRAFRWSDSAAE
jgi:outer membrane protein assembly factor BamB